MTRLRYLAAAVVLFLITVPLHANTITPGEMVSPDVFAIPTSENILASTTGSFSLVVGTGTITGTYTDLVAVDPFNVTCPTCLDFAVEITVDSAPAGASITEVFNGGLSVGAAPSAVDVGYVNGGNIAPSTVGYGSAGEDIGFNFKTSPLTAGETTDFLVIATDATNYQEVNISAAEATSTGGILQLSGTNGASTATDVGIAGTFLAPVEPPVTTPEPSSLLLLGTGLLAIMGIAPRWKRRV